MSQPERLFSLRLARACGRLDDVDGMLAEMSPDQYRELAALERLEGVDDGQRWDKLFCVLAKGFYAVANRCGLGGLEEIPFSYFKPPETVRVVERPKPGRSRKAASVAEAKALLRTVVAAHNAGAF